MILVMSGNIRPAMSYPWNPKYCPQNGPQANIGCCMPEACKPDADLRGQFIAIINLDAQYHVTGQCRDPLDSP
jgi:hypothetical protein